MEEYNELEEIEKEEDHYMSKEETLKWFKEKMKDEVFAEAFFKGVDSVTEC